MSKKCTLCGSTDVVPYKNNLFGEPMLMCNNCKEPGVWYRFEEPTLFDRITASPEVLAEKLVYDVEWCWFSTILWNGVWSSKEEAIAATVEKLKEVAE